jgi:hypothetical protein
MTYNFNRKSLSPANARRFAYLGLALVAVVFPAAIAEIVVAFAQGFTTLGWLIILYLVFASKLHRTSALLSWGVWGSLSIYEVVIGAYWPLGISVVASIIARIIIRELQVTAGIKT